MVLVGLGGCWAKGYTAMLQPIVQLSTPFPNAERQTLLLVVSCMSCSPRLRWTKACVWSSACKAQVCLTADVVAVRMAPHN